MLMPLQLVLTVRYRRRHAAPPGAALLILPLFAAF